MYPKTEEISNENIPKEFTPKIELIPFDFSTSEVDSYLNLYKQLENYNINCLINNVGYLKSGKLGEISNEEIIKMVNVNCLSHSYLTLHFLDEFNKRKNDKKTGIFNVGSQTAEIKNKNDSIYFASKFFNNVFGYSLINEMNFNKNIDFGMFILGLIRTPMFNKYVFKENEVYKENFKTGLIIENSDYVAKKCVDSIGRTSVSYAGEKQEFFFNFFKIIKPIKDYIW